MYKRISISRTLTTQQSELPPSQCIKWSTIIIHVFTNIAILQTAQTFAYSHCHEYVHMPNWWTHYNTEHSIIPTAIAISTLPNVTSIVCGMISKPCSFLNHANAIHIGIHEATELAQIKSSPSFKLTANSICLNNSSVHQRHRNGQFTV